MDFFNSEKKYLGLSSTTWLIIVVIVIFILVCKTCENFTSVGNSGITAYNFNANWCGWSRKLEPEWQKFESLVKNSELSHVNVVNFKMDDDSDPKVREMSAKYKIQGFPTIIFEKDGVPIMYRGKREATDIFNFLNRILSQQPQEEDRKDIMIYNFNTNWCGWSKRFQPEFDKFSELIKNDPKYQNVKSIDFKCDNPEDPHVIEKTSKYGVDGYPTVIFDIKGEHHVYNGPRTSDAVLAHLDSLL